MIYQEDCLCSMKTFNRLIVEATKRAQSISIILNANDRDNKIVIKPISNKRLSHDIALALQSFFINEERNEIIQN